MHLNTHAEEPFRGAHNLVGTPLQQSGCMHHLGRHHCPCPAVVTTYAAIMRPVNIATELWHSHSFLLTDCQQTRLLFPRLAAHNGCLLARARTLFAMKGIEKARNTSIPGYRSRQTQHCHG